MPSNNFESSIERPLYYFNRRFSVIRSISLTYLEVACRILIVKKNINQGRDENEKKSRTIFI